MPYVCEMTPTKSNQSLSSLEIALSFSPFSQLITSLDAILNGTLVFLRSKQNNKYVSVVSHWFGQTNLHAFKVRPTSKNDLFQLIKNSDGSFSFVSQVNNRTMCVVLFNQTYFFKTNDCEREQQDFDLIYNGMDATFSFYSKANQKYVSAIDLDVDALQALFDTNLNQCHFYVERLLEQSFSVSSSTKTTLTSTTKENIITVTQPTNGDIANTTSLVTATTNKSLFRFYFTLL